MSEPSRSKQLLEGPCKDKLMQIDVATVKSFLSNESFNKLNENSTNIEH